MPLTLLNIGEKAHIVGLSCGPKLKKYLMELGFCLGKKIEVIQSSFGDNIIVAIEGARLALDRKMAHQINISLLKEETNAC